MLIDVVVVTFNRLNKLKNTLSCYNNLSVKPRNIIVVNNNSSDGTKEYLDGWFTIETTYRKHVIHLDNNIGGSGGFYEGQKYAMQLNPDWIMISDDDAYPAPDLFESFILFVSKHNTENVSAVYSSVLHTDGTIDTAHRSSYKLLKGIFYERNNSRIEDYQKEYFEIDFLSYVGCFIKRTALDKAGLVNPKYFINFDDTEHSLRLKKQGKIICLPQMKIVHDDNNLNATATLSWKTYYLYRNELHMLIKHHPIAAIAWCRRRLKLLSDNPKRKQVYKIAMKDAWMVRLGIHELYKPGWTDTVFSK